MRLANGNGILQVRCTVKLDNFFWFVDFSLEPVGVIYVIMRLDPWQNSPAYICLTSVTRAKPKEKMAFPA